jgi:hypothetical protein
MFICIYILKNVMLLLLSLHFENVNNNEEFIVCYNFWRSLFFYFTRHFLIFIFMIIVKIYVHIHAYIYISYVIVPLSSFVRAEPDR